MMDGAGDVVFPYRSKLVEFAMCLVMDSLWWQRPFAIEKNKLVCGW